FYERYPGPIALGSRGGRLWCSLAAAPAAAAEGAQARRRLFAGGAACEDQLRQGAGVSAVGRKRAVHVAVSVRRGRDVRRQPPPARALLQDLQGGQRLPGGRGLPVRPLVEGVRAGPVAGGQGAPVRDAGAGAAEEAVRQGTPAVDDAELAQGYVQPRGAPRQGELGPGHL